MTKDAPNVCSFVVIVCCPLYNEEKKNNVYVGGMHYGIVRIREEKVTC